ncbi:MAG: DUF1326 domain-containing protein [Gammaproteobacteria bacterium]|nr:DUF1326 domain-containing protein [Rhodocyclaceae bacterium]MBU3909691.1 DUF1326 domain-containing protein [Gammaproteobacteria bacterium]MBU3988041.1 DUF1326 domain-containing protein [Gammaproteobacteria bacterium]MBU4005224.1 DUF1326 domain-containing protein [Gammaproteobacteria bacterium]MBU4022403.1 DUF1326 domain-containing protein [Gammaproteobacteria bacterium]
MTTWNLKGSYFEACNCDVACPCVFLGAPTAEECTALVAWHVDQGNFGDVKVDGLNVALAVHSPGHMAEVKWKVALYLDEKASEAQRDALTQIFGGKAGGHPALLAANIGEVIGVKNVPMTFAATGKQRTLDMGKIGAATIESIEGQGGAEVTISNHPLCIAPGHAAVASRSKEVRYEDHGLSWQFSNKNGFHSPFTYQGA